MKLERKDSKKIEVTRSNTFITNLSQGHSASWEDSTCRGREPGMRELMVHLWSSVYGTLLSQHVIPERETSNDFLRAIYHTLSEF